MKYNLLNVCCVLIGKYPMEHGVVIYKPMAVGDWSMRGSNPMRGRSPEASTGPLGG